MHIRSQSILLELLGVRCLARVGIDKREDSFRLKGYGYPLLQDPHTCIEKVSKYYLEGEINHDFTHYGM